MSIAASEIVYRSRRKFFLTLRFVWCYLFVGLCGISISVYASPFIELPSSGIKPNELAVVYLQGDQQSEAIARYYQNKRGIPSANVVAIKLDPQKTVIDPGVFVVQQKVLEAQLDEHIQAYALAWAKPYRVGCMSMTAAFTFGFNVAYCSDSCNKTRLSPYHHSASIAPYRDFGMRPSMMLAANNFDDAKALIDRGIAADDTQPYGTALFVKTSDGARSVRHVYHDQIKKVFAEQFDIQLLNQDTVKNKVNVLLYFTGARFIDDIETHKYLPGAMADHLTSAGGKLTDSKQMSAMRWLEAGATGSYGAAIEPCNFLEKFPNPLLAMWHYVRGASLLEAYWKSVLMPGQGNFIGEPLATPFKGYRIRRDAGAIQIHSPVLHAGRYRLWGDDFGVSRKINVQTISKTHPYIRITPPYSHSYRVERY